MPELTELFPPKTVRQRTFLTRAEVAFWEKVRSSRDGCWEWTGGRRWDEYMEYGSVCVAGKHIGAHRLSWMIHHGAIPIGLCVLHKCDNPLCVRPDHLFLGTKLDNAIDRDQKGRRTAPRGERHYKSRVTDDVVRTLRADYDAAPLSSGGYLKRRGTVAALATRYGLTFQQVYFIVSRRSWRHI